MRRKGIVIVPVIALLATLMVGVTAVGASLDSAPETGIASISAYRGVPRVTRAVFNDGNPSTSSTTFVEVPGMRIDHYMPIQKAETLLVTVSAFSRCQDADGAVDAWCLIEVLVDGVQCNPGGLSVFDSAPENGNDVNAWAAHSFQFVCQRSAKGWHDIVLRFRVDEVGATFSLDNVVMSVQTSRGW